MNRIASMGAIRDFGLVMLVASLAVAVVAALVSDSVSAVLSSRADLLYVAFGGSLIVIVVLVRVVYGLQARRFASEPVARSSTPDAPGNGILVREPSARVSLGSLVAEARQELCFIGISAKRTVTEDLFRRSLERHDGQRPKLRFLLLDPDSQAFELRAQDEREPADAWRNDLEVTEARLRAYKESIGIDVELRYSSRYPVWRAIIVDREMVYVSPFLHGKRGTEAAEYVFSRSSDPDLVHGFLKELEISWESAREVRL